MNARFRVFNLSVRDRQTDGPTERPTNGRTDGRTDKASYRVACRQLKIQSDFKFFRPMINFDYQAYAVYMNGCINEGNERVNR